MFTDAIVGDLQGNAETATALTPGNKVIQGDLEVQGSVSIKDALYFGDATQDGTWRIRPNGVYIVFERRKDAVWEVKLTLDAGD